MSGRRFSLIVIVALACGCAKQPPSPPPVVAPQTVVAPPAAVTPVTEEKPVASVAPPATPVTSAVASDPSPAAAPTAKDPNSPPPPKEMLKQAGTGVVLITVYDALGEKVGMGSGCIVAKGWILTNYHVIVSAVTAQVQTRGDKEGSLGPALNVNGFHVIDEKNDLAVLSVEGLPESAHIFTLADPDKIEQFDKVFAIGHPDGLKFTTSPGFVNGMMKTSDLPEQLQAFLKNPQTEWIQTDAVIAGGSSGGPLLNEHGQIVGINTLRVGTRAGLAVRVRHVAEMLGNLDAPVAALPVPDSNVLVTRVVAETKRTFDMELRQLMMDLQQHRASGDTKKAQELIRKNNPAPPCLHMGCEIVRKYRGKQEADDAIRFCAGIVANGPGRNEGRQYLDQLFEEAAQDPTLIPATAKVMNSLSGIHYSPELDRYLRAVLEGEADNRLKGCAGTVLVSAMAASNDESLTAEMVDLAKLTSERYGDELFQGKKVSEHLNPLLEENAFAIGGLAPDISGNDAEGKDFRLSDYRGKVVVLDFWADWCPHCRNMYPHEREMVERLKDQPFALVGVNGDEPGRARRAIDAGNVTWRTWFDGPQGPIVKQYKIESWPTIFVLDKEGRIRFKDVRGPELDAAVNSLLNDESFPAANEIVASDANWKYRTVAGSDAVEGWRDAGFDDAAWMSGAGPFGTGQERTRLEPPATGPRPLTTLFRTSFDKPAGELPSTLLMRIRVRDGVAVYLNGTEIHRDHLTLNATFGDGATERASSEQAGGVIVQIDSGMLKPTGNCLAVELHQFSKYSSQAFFDLTLGTLPDLAKLAENDSPGQQLAMSRLLTQISKVPGAEGIIEKMQTAESIDIQVAGAIAAAVSELPIKLKKKPNAETSQRLAQAIVKLNGDSWDIVCRDDMSPLQYADGLRKARAGYLLLGRVPAQLKPAVDGVINTYGVALYRTGDYEKANEILKESMKSQGDNPVDIAYVCLSFRRQGKTAEADEQKAALTKMMESDEWMHQQSAQKALKEVEREFAK